ncbi:MAG: hypothetical protein QOK03_1165, partial [Candidatus Binataceae bacterium]|nr:hypothetical protein [Candidatus Binataceae bacterium]
MRCHRQTSEYLPRRVAPKALLVSIDREAVPSAALLVRIHRDVVTPVVALLGA